MCCGKSITGTHELFQSWLYSLHMQMFFTCSNFTDEPDNGRLFLLLGHQPRRTGEVEGRGSESGGAGGSDHSRAHSGHALSQGHHQGDNEVTICMRIMHAWSSCRGSTSLLWFHEISMATTECLSAAWCWWK